MAKKSGFTLVEMTISMIVIAVIAAFITPNITKKLSTKAKANANQLTSDCKQFDFTDSEGVLLEGYCKLCYEHKCVSCKLDYRQGYTIIQNTCQYKKCSELFTGCVAKCSEIECLDELDPANWKYDYQNGEDTSSSNNEINNDIASSTPPLEGGGKALLPSLAIAI